MANKGKPPTGDNRDSEWTQKPGLVSPERTHTWTVPRESPVAPARHWSPGPHKQPVEGPRKD